MSRRLRFVVVLVHMVLLVGCGSAPPATPARPPSSSPPRNESTSPPLATPPVPGLSWVKAASVARPEDAFIEPSIGTGPAGPGTAGHPGHYAGQAIVDDVAASTRGLVAVGYVGLAGDWTAIAWTSTDAETWTLAPIDDTAGSFAVSVTSAPDGGLVAVGRSGRDAIAWTSPDGRTWTRRAMPALPDDREPERATVVIAAGGGFLAGGSVGPELGDRRARFWRSDDGATWEPIRDDTSFDGGEVVALGRSDRSFVALARLGTGQRSTGSRAWTSSDGIAWTRANDAVLKNGLVAGVATAVDGTLVAVGSDLDEREAVVWRSADGSSWDRVVRQESMTYNGGDKIRMTDVTAVPGGLIAVGNFVSLQYGTATSWTSSDGTIWTRAAAYPALEQGEMLGVAQGGPGLVSVGSFGAPDNYIPTIWLGPAPPA